MSVEKARSFEELKTKVDGRAADWESLTEVERDQRIAQAEAEWQASMNEQRQLRIDRKLAQIPIRHRHCVLGRADIKRWCDGLMVQPSGSDVKGLLIVGPVGTGKTGTLWAVYRYLAEHEAQIHLEIHKVPDLLDELRPPKDRSVHEFARVDLLALDDLGAEKNSEWQEQKLFQLLDYRYEHCLPTILTTNVADVKGLLGDRLASRIAQSCDVITVTGKDRRRVSK